MKGFKTLVPLALIALGLLSTPACGQFTYSWQGTISTVGVEDPWSLGSVPLPFSLLAEVELGAMDVEPSLVDTAVFGVVLANLDIFGEPIALNGNGFLEFGDGTIAGTDSLVFTGDFEREGVVERLLSSLTLDSGIFQFGSADAEPPIFGVALNSDNTGGIGGNYMLDVQRGAMIVAVPEPCSVLLMLGLAMAAFVRR